MLGETIEASRKQLPRPHCLNTTLHATCALGTSALKATLTPNTKAPLSSSMTTALSKKSKQTTALAMPKAVRELPCLHPS